jgi:tRNA pseudouridine38-40 synthase
LDTLTLAVTLAYRGTDFRGFARQEHQPTVQGALEDALQILFRREVLTVGAGRTDSGVHALGQVVSFQVDSGELGGRSLDRLRNSINALTPDSIVVHDLTEQPAGFSARFSAIEREYRYRLVASPIQPLFLAPYVWWLPTWQLDVNLIKQALPAIIGEHDFRSFCTAVTAVDKNTIRKVSSVNIFSMDHLGEHCTVVQVIGNAFLHSMVRIIVGSLVEIGQLRRDPSWLSEVLAAQDRRAAGPTAPAQGLTLWRVRY